MFERILVEPGLLVDLPIVESSKMILFPKAF